MSVSPHVSDARPLGITIRNAFRFFGMEIEHDDPLYARKVGSYFKFGTQSDFRADPFDEARELQVRIATGEFSSESVRASDMLFALTYLWDLEDVDPVKRHALVNGREAIFKAAQLAFFPLH